MIKRSFIEQLTQDQRFSLPYHIAVKDIECLAAEMATLFLKHEKALNLNVCV